MPDIVNFTLVGAGYFSTPINILELCSGTWLSDVETVCSVSVLLLSFIRCLNLGLIFVPTTEAISSLSTCISLLGLP